MEIVGTDSYGHIRVLSGSTTYDYFGLNEFDVKRIKQLIRRKRFGRAWIALKPFSRPDWVTQEE